MPGRALKSTQIIKADLFKWYRDELRAGRTHTQLQNLEVSMFGQNAAAESLGLHASETNHFLLYTLKHLNLVPGIPQHWKDLLQSCAQLMQIIHGNHDRMPDPAILEFTEFTRTIVRCAALLQMRPRPKYHFLMEMCRMCHRFSPGLAGTWRDEGINKLLKQSAGSAHRMNWQRRVLDDVRVLLVREASQSKRPREY